MIQRSCSSSDPADIEIFGRITTPYLADNFDSELLQAGLTADYPFLTRNLRLGFPIGKMPALYKTIIIPNHVSCAEHPSVVADYLAGEVMSGRMSGPFSLERVERILGGAVFVSPLLVAEQTQEPGAPSKLRICRHLSKDTKDTHSVNSHIEKDAFPARFDTALRVADAVSAHSYNIWLLESWTPFPWALPKHLPCSSARFVSIWRALLVSYRPGEPCSHARWDAPLAVRLHGFRAVCLLESYSTNARCRIRSVETLADLYYPPDICCPARHTGLHS